MPVTDTRKDADARTLTITASFDAPVEQVWTLFSDPRKLEKWWGPPTYPATVTEHSLTPDGTVRYHMTGPEGDRYFGLWHVVSVDEPTHLEFRDSFADEVGAVKADMPTTTGRVTLSERPGGGTDLTVVTTFESPEDMQRLIAMGMEEGIQAAIGQMDDVLAS